eukprot:8888015-Prorocentrum_lima.AAC.1
MAGEQDLDVHGEDSAVGGLGLAVLDARQGDIPRCVLHDESIATSKPGKGAWAFAAEGLEGGDGRRRQEEEA